MLATKFRVISHMVLLLFNGKYPTKNYVLFKRLSMVFNMPDLNAFTTFYFVMHVMFKFTIVSCLRFMHFPILTNAKYKCILCLYCFTYRVR